MNLFALSNHVVLAAIIGGTISAGSNSVIASLADVYVLHTQQLDLKSILSKSLISSLTLGLLLSFVFYTFAVYAYPNAIITPVQIIELFTLFFGLGYPLLDLFLTFIRRELFA